MKYLYLFYKSVLFYRVLILNNKPFNLIIHRDKIQLKKKKKSLTKILLFNVKSRISKI